MSDIESKQLRAVVGYVRRGWSVIPVPYGSKRAVVRGWQELRLKEADLPRYFGGGPTNVGVLMGKLSNNRIDVDLDCPEAIQLAPYFLPRTEAIFGRRSKPRSHYLYAVEGILPKTQKFRMPRGASANSKNSQMLVELRSTGAQTIFPGSTHPSGDRIRWDLEGEPATVRGADVEKAVRKLAAASLLARTWPRNRGSRHDIANALAGHLARIGWGESEVGSLVRRIAEVAGDDEAGERETTARSTVQRFKEGVKVTGGRTLVDLLDPSVAAQASKWLGDSNARLREGSGSLAGSPLAFSDPEPWLKPINGSKLVRSLVHTINSLVVSPPWGALAVALWILHAHLHKIAEVSPILLVWSPTKACGKTSLMAVISKLVPKPLATSSMTEAVLFRAIEKWSPTLLIDEADSFLQMREEMRGILNSGHMRSGATVLRVEGDARNREPRAFSVWAPKAISLIGKLPDTLEDRSIRIPMVRKTRRDHRVKRLRLDRLNELDPLLRKAARWAADHVESIKQRDPEGIPEALSDRAQDNWRPLIAIADEVGYRWAKASRAAAESLSGSRETDEELVGIQLLRALAAIFTIRDVGEISSQEIVDALVEDKEGPWSDFRNGKPISAYQVAAQLRPFGVRPRKWKQGGIVERGYRLADLRPVFERYVPAAHGGIPPRRIATPPPAKHSAGLRVASRVASAPCGVATAKCAKSGNGGAVASRQGGNLGRRTRDLHIPRTPVIRRPLL